MQAMIRPIRTTRTNNDQEVTNSLKCAEKEPPISLGVTVAAVIAGVATLGIGALLIFGIRKYYLAYKAEERLREQAEFACGIVFGEIQPCNNGDQSITVVLSTGYKVVCTEKAEGGLWVSTNGGREAWHPDLRTINDLKNFFKKDIEENIDFYVEKNPDDSVISLFNSVVKRARDIVEIPEADILALTQLCSYVEAINCSARHNHLANFQTSIGDLETYIESNYDEFKGELWVQIASENEQEGIFSLNVMFGDFCIAKPVFKAENSYPDLIEAADSTLYDDSLITLFSEARAKGTEAGLLTFLGAVEASGRDVKFDEFQKSICSLEAFIGENHSDLKGKLRLEVTKNNAVSTFTVKFGDFRIVSSAFADKIPDSDLFCFETNSDKGKAGTILKPKTARSLLNEVSASADSRLFEANIFPLARYLEKMGNKSPVLQLRVEKRGEDSSVAVIHRGKEWQKIDFKGDVKLNDQLFDLVKTDKSKVTGQIFQVKEIGNGTVLKLAIDEIADPRIRTTDITTQASEKNDASLGEDRFDRLFQDYNRFIGALPVSSEDENVLTRDKYIELLERCFSNEAELEKLEADEKEFYLEFIKLSLEDKKAFISIFDKNAAKQSPIIELHSQFLAMELEKKERLRKVLFGIEKNLLKNEMTGEMEIKLDFYGARQKFDDRISALPVRDQALLLISVDQDYRHQLALNRGAFVGKLDAGQESIYSIKCLPVDPNKPKEVRVEMASQFNFLMSILLQSMISGPIEPVVLMDEKVSGVFTISLENSETFVGAHLRLSDVKSMLTIHNADGTVSEVCKNNAVNLPAVPTKLEQPQDDARSTLTIRGKDGTTANGTVSQTHKSSAESQSAVATKWEKLDDDARSTLTIRGNDGTILNAYKDGFENLSGAQTKTMQPDAEFFASL